MDDDHAAVAKEERFLYLAMIVAGAPPVIGTLATHQAFSGGVSLCLGVVALGIVGMVGRRRRARIPQATVTDRSDVPR